MISDRWVRVVAQNIYDVRAWVPAGSDRVPEPDQVAELVDFSVAGIHQSVELYAALWTPGSPPMHDSLRVSLLFLEGFGSAACDQEYCIYLKTCIALVSQHAGLRSSMRVLRVDYS